MRSNLLRIFASVVLTTIAPAIARAYVLFDPVISWQPGTVTFQIKLGDTPALIDGSHFTSSVQTAMQAWNAQLGTLQLNGVAATASDTYSGNRTNEIVFNTKVDGEDFGEGVLAVTLLRISPSIDDIQEADIVLNRKFEWNSYRGSVRSGTNDIRRVALHELGHALGLTHANESSSVMFKSVTNVDGLSPDDIAGARFLYAAPGETTIPVNDTLSNATNVFLSSNTATVTGTNVYATRQTGEPSHARNTASHSLWWKWTAPSTGTMVINSDGSRFDTVIAVYTGSAVASLSSVTSNDDVEDGVIRYSSVQFNTVAGVTYQIAVDGWDSARGFVKLNFQYTPPAPPPGSANTPSRLVNIATRARCETGDNVTIGGFVISGSARKRVLVRAVGPSLTAQQIGAAEVLADPMVEVFKAGASIAKNDNWSTEANAAEMTAVAAQIGAAPLLATDTTSSTLLLDLDPGVYSFVATGKSASSGIVLLEVYDADIGGSNASFVNIATRAFCTTGNGVTIGGFVISGSRAKQVLLRAVGPSLTKQNIRAADVLADPYIELHAGQPIIEDNDNWSESPNAAAIASIGARIGATPFDAADTKSAALIRTLQPGVYSFIASGKAGTSGIVLVEVYDAD